MRYELRDYQRDAALEVLKRLRRARRDLSEGDRSSFALSAITGSGKTVIATAVIEALLFGSSDLDTDVDPRVAFLWITDDPALNRQTRGRMLEASELMTPWSLREVDESFPDSDLAPHGGAFVRIESIARAGDDLRVLDLKESAVRVAVRAFKGGKVTALYESAIAKPYL